MNTNALIDRLERFGRLLPVIVMGVPDDEARWKPDGDAWSILEIVTHMADEEVGDFRTRLEHTLRDPTAKWPPIDPEGWAVERRYNEGSLAEAVGRFLFARRESAAWLRSLSDPAWSNTFEHPKARIRAGDLLASWVAHDALHLRQIAKRMFQLTQRDAGDFKTDYAGSWTA